MLFLGLLLVVLSGAAAALLIAYNTTGAEQTVSVFGRDLASVTMMQAFVAGLIVALVFMLGLWMLMSASRRARENRARYREARREAKAAAAERDELAEQLRHEEEHRHQAVGGNVGDRTDTMATPHGGAPMSSGDRTDAMPAGAPPQPRHTAPAGQQPVITNIKPGNSPTR